MFFFMYPYRVPNPNQLHIFLCINETEPLSIFSDELAKLFCSKTKRLLMLHLFDIWFYTLTRYTVTDDLLFMQKVKIVHPLKSSDFQSDLPIFS